MRRKIFKRIGIVNCIKTLSLVVKDWDAKHLFSLIINVDYAQSVQFRSLGMVKKRRDLKGIKKKPHF
jgi:hypothetical protein